MTFITYLYPLIIYLAIIFDLNNFDDSFYILIVSTIKLKIFQIRISNIMS